MKIQPMTGLQRLIQAKKLKEKSEELEEAKMEAMMFKLAMKKK